MAAVLVAVVLHRTTAGLLHHEHVGRLRDFRRDRLGTDAGVGARARGAGGCAARCRRVLGAGKCRICLRAADGHWGTTAARSTAWRTLQEIPLSTWLGFRSLCGVRGLALLFFPAIAPLVHRQNRERIALTAIAAAMVPIGFAMIDGVARVAPYFSLADAAAFINARVAPNDKVIYEGRMHTGEQPGLLSRAKILSGEPGSRF